MQAVMILAEKLTILGRTKSQAKEPKFRRKRKQQVAGGEI
jgi:hypothetical protein